MKTLVAITLAVFLFVIVGAVTLYVVGITQNYPLEEDPGKPFYWNPPSPTLNVGMGGILVTELKSKDEKDSDFTCPDGWTKVFEGGKYWCLINIDDLETPVPYPPPPDPYPPPMPQVTPLPVPTEITLPTPCLPVPTSIITAYPTPDYTFETAHPPEGTFCDPDGSIFYINGEPVCVY